MPPVEKKIYPYRKWMMAAAAIIILAVVSSVSLYFLGTPAADEIRHIQTPALASTPDALPGVQQPDMQGTAVEPVLRPVTREDRLAKVDRNHTEQKTGVDPLGIGNENKPSTGNGEDSLSEEDKNVKGNGETENVKDEPKQAENTDVSQGQSQDTERSNNRPRRPSGKDKLHIPTEKRSSQKGTWSMGLSVGNSGGASTEVGAGSHAYMSRVSMLSVSNGLMETIPNDQTLVFEDGVPYLRQAKQVVDIKHHQPISFGLSVRKGLAKGFSLETGLTYTLLSSDAKLAGEEQQIEQKLHYIGIPLRANWNFLDKKLVTLYVSGGGMVEKCVYGKLGSEKETVKPLQFSVSGGVGALKGPSIMPGGQKEAYELVAPILTKIAAVAEDGEPCVTYIGADGAGHYVKMVHNGIEYGDMQLIAEAYSLLKGGLNLSNEELAQTFTEWNNGELSSYLIDITKDIFNKKDEDGNYLVDVILDEAANKGTGKWTSQSALDLGEPLSLITESVFARYISSLKDQRVAASKVLSGPQAQPAGDKAEFIEKVRRALYLGKIVSYAQGFSQLRAASEEYNWDLNYGEIAKIFRAGCIIRAQFLQKITDAYAENPQIANLLLAPYFKQIADDYQQALRDVVAYAVQNGIPVPTFAAAVAYYDSYRAAVLPANLIQAQRDYFGAHTYKRIDKEGVFHTEWLD